MRGKDQTKEWLVSEKDRFDNDLDRNKDGYLDDPEIGSWIVPSNDEIAQVQNVVTDDLVLRFY